MAQKTDVGVPQDPAADITAVPTITDIGVPTNYTLADEEVNDPNAPTDDRVETNPDARNGDLLGMGTPYNPSDGVISE